MVSDGDSKAHTSVEFYAKFEGKVFRLFRYMLGKSTREEAREFKSLWREFINFDGVRGLFVSERIFSDWCEKNRVYLGATSIFKSPRKASK